MRNFITYCLLWVSVLAVAQRVTVNGYVTDKESGERLIGAAVYDTISQQGVVTNTSGFYTLTLPAGQHALQVSYVGYHPSTVQTLTLTRDTMVQVALLSNTRLDEVTVVSHQSISGPQSAQMSAIEVPISQIKAIPMIAGEVDILKAIQLLPGVQSGTEGSAGLYVRGGGPDENLILLDGVPLYNVNHLMGFFSVFNADAVKNVTLYKGNFPSQYGGRLSSIIDVRQNDGSTQGYHGNISVGLLAARANVEGYIPHKKDSTGTTTFNISGRRTYFDLFTSPLIGLITKASDPDMSLLAGAYFYDLNAKLSHTFANMDDKLSASFYMGDDMLYVNAGDKLSAGSIRYTDDIGMRTGWGNILAALNWEHRYNARLFSNTQLSYTRYRYMLRQSMGYEEINSGVTTESMQERMEYNSSMRDVMIQSNFDYTSSPKNTLHLGVCYTYHQFRPEVTTFSLKQSLEDDTPPMGVDTTFSDGTLHGHEAAIYVEDSFSPWSWLKLNVGLRASLYAIDGKIYPSWEPRVGVRALLYKDLALKLSYAYTTQYIHMLSNSSVSLPSDLWVPVTKNIKPMHSMIVAAGLTYDIMGQCEVGVEGYYKRSTNLLEYKDGATFFGSSTGWQDKVAMGDGWSYGVEVLLQRKVGPVTGWIGYTWSRTMRQFDREGQQVNYGRPFHAKYDREHDLSITLQYDITKHIDIAATFVYGTGTRATLSTQEYYDPTLGNWQNFFEERNNYKMPDYHRLDLGMNFHFPHKYSAWGQVEPTGRQLKRIWTKQDKLEKHQLQMASGKWDWLKDAEHVLNVSIYNVYCHANPYMMMPDMFTNSLYQVSLFPILPSISYTFKF